MDHRAQLLSAGQVPAEFAVPMPDADMDEASEDWLRPGALDYTVLVSYGTPEQQFTMFLGTNSFGMSLICPYERLVDVL